MERLSTKMLVFGSLLGAAGAAWGVFMAGTLGRGINLIIDGSKSNAVWGVPIALTLAFLSVWLAGWVALRSPWKAAASMHCLHYFLLPYVISASIVAVISNTSEWIILGSVILYFTASIAALIVESRRHGKQKRKLEPSERRASLKAMVVPVVAALLATFALWTAMVALVPSGSDPGEGRMLVYGGNLSVVFAWIAGRVASIDFGRFLALALLSGATTGMWTGFLIGCHATGTNPETRPLYIAMGAGLLLGALLSGIAFGAQVVQLVHSYDVAFDQNRAFSGALLAWGACGALVGLLLAGILHGLTGEKAERPRRLANGLAFAAIPLLLALHWASGFVAEKDAGRYLFAKADRLEGQADWVGLGYDFRNYTRRYGNTVIRVHRGGSVQTRQEGCHGQTIRLCDELLRRYPRSAYRAAAMYLKFWCQSRDWQPREALSTWSQLQTNYPRHAFVCRLKEATLSNDRALLGDYEGVLGLLPQQRRTDGDYCPSSEAIHAAKVLGRWDDLIRLYRERMSWTQNADRRFRRRKPDPRIAEYKKRIADAEALKAKRVGPMPRTDISGKVLVNGKPARGIPVCVVPADKFEARDKVQAVWPVSALGGLIGVTDDQGQYQIRQAPSGSYEIVVVLNPQKFQDRKYRIRAAGIPFKAYGDKSTAPQVELF